MSTPQPQPRDLGVISVPFSGGQGKPGVSQAPTYLQNAGLLTQLSDDLGYTVHHTTLPPPPASLSNPSNDPPIRNMKNPLSVSHLTRTLSDEAYSHARLGRLVLTLGGDHSVAIGSIAGISRAVRERAEREGKSKEEGELGVIWVDAHADINTPESSGSGNVHGMPVAWLTGLAQGADPKGPEQQQHEGKPSGQAAANGELEHPDAAQPFSWLPTTPPALNLKKLVYIGLRSVDPPERHLIHHHQIKAYTMHDIDRHGISHIISSALDYLGPHTPLHLSFDVDALDPSYAPSTGTPVRGGLTLREGDFVAERCWGTGRVRGWDLVEVNPILGEGFTGSGGGREGAVEETVRAGVSVVRCGLGDVIL